MELLNGAPLVLNHGAEVRACIGDGTTAGVGRSQSLPEKFMVKVTTSIELDQVAEFNVALNVTIGQGLSGLDAETVKVIHVSAVMLTVVEFHSLSRDNGFKSTKLVWESLKLRNQIPRLVTAESATSHLFHTKHSAEDMVKLNFTIISAELIRYLITHNFMSES